MSDNAPKGEFRHLRAREFTILKHLQRDPSPERLRKFDPWDDEKVGVILAAQITDGQQKGKIHPFDGGTRVLVKQKSDPEYVFDTVVYQMTEQQAARAFLDYNQLSMKPSAFFRYRVGIRAKDDTALAIQRALKEIGVEAGMGHSRYGGDGEPGVFVAFAAAERIITSFRRRTGSENGYIEASDHLVWVLNLCRSAYPQHGDEGSADAHDADIIQAASHLGLAYLIEAGEVEGQVRHAMNTWLGKRTSLCEEGMLMRPANWRQVLISQKGTTAGSESRGAQIGQLIATNYNRGYRPYLRRM